MACDRYWELLSAQLESSLNEAEKQELEEHFAACPDCRAVGAQLAALQAGFNELEDIPAPEGFAQGVMDRIRESEAERKIIPLFKRPQVRALAGLAACLVLVIGLYGAVHPQKTADDIGSGMMYRSVTQDAIEEDLDTPEIAAYCDPGEPIGGTEYNMCRGTEKSTSDAAYDGAALQAAPMINTAVLTLDRLPEGEGIEELLLLKEYSTPDEEGRICIYTSKELLERTAQLAQEEGITASRTSGAEEAEEFLIVVLEGKD